MQNNFLAEAPQDLLGLTHLQIGLIYPVKAIWRLTEKPKMSWAVCYELEEGVTDDWFLMSDIYDMKDFFNTHVGEIGKPGQGFTAEGWQDNIKRNGGAKKFRERWLQCAETSETLIELYEFILKEPVHVQS